MNTIEDLLLRLHDMHGKMSVNNEHRQLVELSIQVLFQQAELIHRLSTKMREIEEKPRVSLV